MSEDLKQEILELKREKDAIIAQREAYLAEYTNEIHLLSAEEKELKQKIKDLKNTLDMALNAEKQAIEQRKKEIGDLVNAATIDRQKANEELLRAKAQADAAIEAKKEAERVKEEAIIANDRIEKAVAEKQAELEKRTEIINNRAETVERMAVEVRAKKEKVEQEERAQKKASSELLKMQDSVMALQDEVNKKIAILKEMAKTVVSIKKDSDSELAEAKKLKDEAEKLGALLQEKEKIISERESNIAKEFAVIKEMRAKYEEGIETNKKVYRELINKGASK